MKIKMNPSELNICLVGEGMDLSGIALCLGNAGHKVSIIRNDLPQTVLSGELSAHLKICLKPNFSTLKQADIVIANTSENLEIKKQFLAKIYQHATKKATITINTESYKLEDLQEAIPYPEQLIGLNWVYPAHQTFFLEVISNDQTKSRLFEELIQLAKDKWGKDPYLLKGGKGIRSRLLAAMARESFYLIDNGYAEAIDIDRACRNDPGYYLSFAGNCRYMDLMGTFLYGVVMKDLNPELSRATAPSKLMAEKINEGNTGIKSGEGFYHYPENQNESFEKDFLKFSEIIKELMVKYPFKDQNIFTE
jgi:3-hydroxybutyryl-CoA dehydrogenase